MIKDYEGRFAAIVVADVEKSTKEIITSFPANDEMFLALIDQLVEKEWRSVVAHEGKLETFATISLKKSHKICTIVLDKKETITLVLTVF